MVKGLNHRLHFLIEKLEVVNKLSDSGPIGVSADLCSAGAP